MSIPDTPGQNPVTCWFCGSRRPDLNSLALPFWAAREPAVEVVVIPRCAACAAFHDRQQAPAAVFIVGAAALLMLPVRLLPLSDGWQTVLTILAMLAGVVIGIAFAAGREDRQARSFGTRPKSAYLEHPGYADLAGKPDEWRQNFLPASGDGNRIRQETVADLRTQFSASPLHANALNALQLACQSLGITT
jgi:hypothetical protein